MRQLCPADGQEQSGRASARPKFHYMCVDRHRTTSPASGFPQPGPPRVSRLGRTPYTPS